MNFVVLIISCVVVLVVRGMLVFFVFICWWKMCWCVFLFLIEYLVWCVNWVWSQVKLLNICGWLKWLLMFSVKLKVVILIFVSNCWNMMMWLMISVVLFIFSVMNCWMLVMWVKLLIVFVKMCLKWLLMFIFYYSCWKKCGIFWGCRNVWRMILILIC